MADRNTMPRSERYRIAQRRLLGAARIALQDAADARDAQVHRDTWLAWQIMKRRDRVSAMRFFAAHREREAERDGVLCGAPAEAMEVSGG